MRHSLKEVGLLAVRMMQLQRQIDAWMREEGKAGHLVFAGDSPLWPQYETARNNFAIVLSANDWSDV